MDSLIGWAGLAALGSMVVAFWGHIRGAWSQAVSHVIVSFDVRDCARGPVLAYCNARLARSRLGHRVFVGMLSYIRPKHCQGIVGYESIGEETALYWDGWRPFWVCRVSGTGKNANNGGWSTHQWPLKISTLRFWRRARKWIVFNPSEFVENSIAYANDVAWNFGRGRYHIEYHSGSAGRIDLMVQTHNESPPIPHETLADIVDRVSVKYLGWEYEQLGQPRAENGVDNLALSDEALAFADLLRKWVKSREWFLDRGLPWKVGALLYGEPGNGKTAFVRAIAEELDIPIHIFDLATLRNDEMRTEWRRMLASLPAIVLLEDIDGVYIGREPTGDKIELTFNCLLNCLDGAERADGLVVFVTTNKPATLDPALGGVHAETGELTTRPGRIDFNLHFDRPSYSGKAKIAQRILADWPESLKMAVALGKDDTGAQFERRCINAAQVAYWKQETRCDGVEVSDEMQAKLNALPEGGMEALFAKAHAEDDRDRALRQLEYSDYRLSPRQIASVCRRLDAMRRERLAAQVGQES